jgi:hypothetical protein
MEVISASQTAWGSSALLVFSLASFWIRSVPGQSLTWKCWQWFLLGLLVLIFSDHANLKHFMTAETLTPKQARLAAYLDFFNFKLLYLSVPLTLLTALVADHILKTLLLCLFPKSIYLPSLCRSFGLYIGMDSGKCGPEETDAVSSGWLSRSQVTLCDLGHKHSPPSPPKPDHDLYFQPALTKFPTLCHPLRKRRITFSHSILLVSKLLVCTGTIVRTSDKGLSQGFFSRSSRDCSNSLI